jgi:hypothetical protein
MKNKPDLALLHNHPVNKEGRQNIVILSHKMDSVRRLWLSLDHGVLE